MIKIDMKMPENCERCGFLYEENEDYTCLASFVGDMVDEPEGDRPDWCPLIEDSEASND